MRIKTSLLALVGLSIAACGSIDDQYTTPVNHAPTMVTTLKKAPSNKPVKALAACIASQLNAHYPSGYVRYRIENFYDGAIPGPEANQPLATYDIFADSAAVLGYITLQQREPVDSAVTELFKSCL